jgi:chromosome segregation ATPase
MKINDILLLALFSVSCSAQSEVYKYVDKSGNITYSDTPLKDAQKLELPPLTVVPSTNIKLETETLETSVDKNEGHREAINKMIAEETKLLEEKKKEYNGGKPERIGSERNYQRYLDRIQQLKNEIALHEENIGTLNLELQNLGDPN